MLITFLSWP
jgi:hypothetical protein